MNKVYDIQARFEAAKEAALAAGKLITSRKNYKIVEKAANDYVTEMDKASESLIRERLLGQFPEDGFFGEESGGEKNTLGRWIVDPIDGTQSFMRGQLTFCVSIAYQHNGEIVVGVVYNPATDELFSAMKGAGATLNGESIHVSDITEPAEAIVHLGYCHRNASDRRAVMPVFPYLMDRVSDMRRYGTAAYEICTVACGRSEAFFEYHLQPYDIAAGSLILTEAGGRATAWKMGEDIMAHCDTLATNGHIHEFMLEALSHAKF